MLELFALVTILSALVADAEKRTSWVWAYHVTSRSLIPAIQKEGLRPSWHDSVPDAPVLFVEPTLEGVQPYLQAGTVVLRFRTPGFGCTEDGEDVLFGGSETSSAHPEPPFVGARGSDGVIPPDRIEIRIGNTWQPLPGATLPAESPAAQVRRFQREAELFYGVTDDPYSAAFLLSDGQWLDFSEGGGNGRAQDHRNVAHLLPDSDLADESRQGAQTQNMRTWMIRAQAMRVSRSPSRSGQADYVLLDFPRDPVAAAALLQDRRSILRYADGAAVASVALPDGTREEIDPYSPSALREVLDRIRGGDRP